MFYFISIKQPINCLDIQENITIAVVLFNIANVIFDQVEVSNYSTTALVCFNSRVTFDGHSIL